MKVTQARARRLIAQLGFKTCDDWKDERVVKKLNFLGSSIADDFRLGDLEMDELLDSILYALEQGDEIELIEDHLEVAVVSVEIDHNSLDASVVVVENELVDESELSDSREFVLPVVSDKKRKARTAKQLTSKAVLYLRWKVDQLEIKSLRAYVVDQVRLINEDTSLRNIKVSTALSWVSRWRHGRDIPKIPDFYWEKHPEVLDAIQAVERSLQNDGQNPN